MVELRQIVNELIQQQLNDYPDADIKATQEKLNTAYDAFAAKYGLLNDRKNGMTACDGGTTDSDKIMPDDGTVEVVMTINNTAANKGLGQVEYSAKYSAVTKALLENWLEWRNDGSNTKYRENYDKITAELGNVKIVVGLTKDTTPLAAQANYNPATRTSFKYDSLFKDESAFNLAEKIGVAYVTTSNGTVYQAVCLFDVN